jgi:ribosomal protein L11 methyltransferase
MSFGTGHHETTHMMIQHLLETEVTGMKTLDMGCGTAILASSRNERRSTN